MTGEYQQIVLVDFDTSPRRRTVVATVMVVAEKSCVPLSAPLLTFQGVEHCTGDQKPGDEPQRRPPPSTDDEERDYGNEQESKDQGQNPSYLTAPAGGTNPRNPRQRHHQNQACNQPSHRRSSM
ncbi:MAG: hypothetical protein NTU53_04555 [Planctomycetota bacterium]|nr:hypothetical protein [Planctomycetota bacterium]